MSTKDKSSGTETAVDGEGVSDKRDKKFTEKGRHLAIEGKRGVRSNILRHLKRQQEKINSYLQEGHSSLPRVKDAYAEWLSFYEDFLDENDALQWLLTKEEANTDYEDYSQAKIQETIQFKEKIWFASVAQEADTLKPSDSVSRVGSHRSKSSVRSFAASSLSTAKVKEIQKQAEILAKITSLREQEELEKAKVSLLMQGKELKLKMEMRASEARKHALEEQEDILSHSSRGSRHSKIVTQANIKREDRTVGGINPEAEIFVPRPQPSYMVQTRSPNNDQPLVDSNFENRARSVDQIQSLQNKYDRPDSQESNTMLLAIKELRKPVCNIIVFSGNPMEYRQFMRQFHTRVVVNTSTDDEKMSYLEQYTSGETNRIVAGFCSLDARVGYAAALKELEYCYGDNETIANAYIEKALKWPVIKADDPKGLDAFSVFLIECQNAISSLNASQILDYPESTKRLIKKLPYYMHDKWCNLVFDAKEQGKRVSFDQLVSLVRREARKVIDPTYGKIAMASGSGDKKRKPEHRFSSKGSFATSMSNSLQVNKTASGEKANTTTEDAKEGAVIDERDCLYCSRAHDLEHCNAFKTHSVEERLKFLKGKGACYGCLRIGHLSKNCKNRATCSTCQKRHPTVLHINEQNKVKEANSTQDEGPKKNEGGQCAPSLACTEGASQHKMETEANECTLAVIPVLVKSKTCGTVVKTYAFLDPGSSISFCAEWLVDQLQMDGKHAKITIDTMRNLHTMKTKIITDLEVCSLEGDNSVNIPQAYTKDRMPVSQSHVPTQDDIARWPHLQDVKLQRIKADVGLLIGNSVADAYTPLQVLTGPRGSPHATKSLLGWIVWNVVWDSEPKERALSVNSTEIVAVEQLEENQRLERLVRTAINMDFPEQGIDTQKQPSREDRLFEEKVQRSLKFDNGHYSIALPFRNEDLKLPDNRLQAIKRLASLKGKLFRNETFLADYKDFMSNIISSGYAELVPEYELKRNDGRVWYIPHHGVYHPRKPGKIRVVFDCSAKYEGVSLNDTLLQGPNLTNDLTGVLLGFRQQPVAIMGDIEKMFYQVKVPVEDRDFLRFFWWPDGDLSMEVREFRMTVHLFGSTSSPACANMALQQTLRDNAGDQADSLLANFYVDDYLESVETAETGTHRVKELKGLCKKGGFNVSSWTSNSEEVIKSIPLDDCSKEVKRSIDNNDIILTERALGVVWTPVADTLNFRVSLPNKPPTRRGILSVVSSVYDPMGLAAPYILPAKILLQRLTKQGKDWDDIIDGDDLKDWRQWLNNIPLLERLEIPRSVGLEKSKDICYELHTFADASENGYGTASYIRLLGVDGYYKTNLLFGKARVAPLKKITIPRMELTAATIAVKLAAVIRKELQFNFSRICFWTDSMLVLRYINNTVSRFHTFVANRLTSIHEGSSPNQWYHVDTMRNPADLVSRGMSLGSETEKSLWLRGPDFLSTPESEWPDSKIDFALASDDPEVRKTVASTVSSSRTTEEGPLDELFSRFTSWRKLKVFIAWMIRLKNNLKEKVKNRKSTEPSTLKCLTLEDLDEAEKIIILHEQNKTSFKGMEKLDPFKDAQSGIVRVGGRLARASLSTETKHPILIPKGSLITGLIVNDIVLVADSSPRGQWKMGKIIEVFEGRDTLGRSAKVKTQVSVLCRPITKLVKLLEADR